MTGGTEILEILLRGIALGSLIATAFSIARNGASPSVRIAGSLFCACVFAYVLNSSPHVRPLLGIGLPIVSFLSWGGVGALLQARPALFGAAPLQPARAPDTTAADRAEIAQLTAFVKDQEAWRRESLAIGDLAADLHIPEHRLRRLINDYLGHRNFAAFINSHRIEAAKGMLADVKQARRTVSAIAFDLGFGSLGPFNRAFKEVTGQTPTEWRRQALRTDGEGKS